MRQPDDGNCEIIKQCITKFSILVELKKCLAIEMDNIDMSDFMKTVFKGDDKKINRKVSLPPPPPPPPLFIFPVFQSEIWVFRRKLLTPFLKSRHVYI